MAQREQDALGDTNAGLEEQLAEQRKREEEWNATKGAGVFRSSILC